MKISLKLIEMTYGNFSRRWIADIETEKGEIPICCICNTPFREKQDAWLIGQGHLNCLGRNCVNENGVPLGINNYGHHQKIGKDENDTFILINSIKELGALL